MSTAQNFKGDATELKMIAVADPIFDLTSAALDELYAEGFQSTPFLLAMYDTGRMPFSNTVNRDAFVQFIIKALGLFPFTGSFEAYLDVLGSVFGEESLIRFTVPEAGHLSIDIEAVADTEFQFIGREFSGGSFTVFDMVDSDGNDLLFKGLATIDDAYSLGLLIKELMPVGIIPDLSLAFFEISRFIDFDGDEMTDDDGNFMVFVEPT